MNLNEIDLERFEHTGQSFTARVSISKYGLISFNEGARLRFGLNDYEYAVLHYAKSPRLIAVRLTHELNERGALALRKRNTGAYVSAKSFVEYYNLGINNTMTYPVYKDEDTGMLYWLLKEGKERAGGRTGEEVPE